MVQMQSVKARKKKSSALNKEGENNKYESTDEDDYKKAKSISEILRPTSDEVVKISELDRKNMKKQLKYEFKDFPEDEYDIGDISEAALLMEKTGYPTKT